MKLNKMTSALVLAMGLSAFGVQAADQGSGEVRFRGSIIDAPCSIHPDSEDQDVYLGQVASSQLLNEGTSTPRPFNIKLEKCDVTTMSEVTVEFGGTTVTSGAKELLGITGTGAGAGIVITDGTGTPVKMATPTKAHTLIAGDNTLLFSAYLQGLNGVTPTTGEFQSVTNFTLSYQ
ncbi:fimbrial protein [Citrobacter sp. Cb003]|uniref:fimbrial protein n=1 Tax=Citrobacter sp. Cb003 TaxID=2985005 RepID=UPI00257A2EBA|nr:fimbrial protein [Citrobacter sp. Cb003]MDM3379292.1 fimbrial protein [Citrobacter sp. Cb003]